MATAQHTTTKCLACQIESADCECGLSNIMLRHQEEFEACNLEVTIIPVQAPDDPDQTMFSFSVIHHDINVIDQWLGQLHVASLSVTAAALNVTNIWENSIGKLREHAQLVIGQPPSDNEKTQS